MFDRLGWDLCVEDFLSGSVKWARHLNYTSTPVTVVISFTTSPTRLHNCRPMVESLLCQTRRPDAIVLSLPPRFDRTGEEYPPDALLPNWLIDEQLIKIERCDRDWGPATKIVPTVARLQQEPHCSIIITVDDDIRYPSTAISALAGAALPCAVGGYEREVWCAAGLDFVNLQKRKHGECCAVAEGYAGVAYPTRVFESDFVAYMRSAILDEDMRFSDDLVVSNYLAFHDVKRRVLICAEYSQDALWNSGGVLAYGDQPDALHRGAGSAVNNVDRYRRCWQSLPQ
jgi:hypothetical protein